MRRFLILSLLLAGCGSTPKHDESASGASVAPTTVDARSTLPAPAGSTSGRAAPQAAPSSKLLGRPVRVLPTRPLNLQTQCRFQNETGYNGTASVEVANGQVKRLNALFNVPDRDQCQIDLTRLKQTRSQPSVELRDTASGCTARMWEQGDQATISFTGCASYCSNPDAFAYVWPILIKRSSGRCD